MGPGGEGGGGRGGKREVGRGGKVSGRREVAAGWEGSSKEEEEGRELGLPQEAHEPFSVTLSSGREHSISALGVRKGNSSLNLRNKAAKNPSYTTQGTPHIHSIPKATCSRPYGRIYAPNKINT